MRAEEIKRMKAAILKCFGLPENVNPKNVDEKTKSKLKAYGRQVSPMRIEDALRETYGDYFPFEKNDLNRDNYSESFLS